MLLDSRLHGHVPLMLASAEGDHFGPFCTCVVRVPDADRCVVLGLVLAGADDGGESAVGTRVEDEVGLAAAGCCVGGDVAGQDYSAIIIIIIGWYDPVTLDVPKDFVLASFSSL